MPPFEKHGRVAASRVIVATTLIVIGVCAAATYSYWRSLVARPPASAPHADADAEAHDHDTHGGHSHGGGVSANADQLTLSTQAQRNLGLRVGPVELQTYQRAITIPGMIVERPGRTSIAVAAPLSGVITQISAVEGEAVAPGQELFKIRLTHEEIVQAQGEFLKTLAELDVTRREMNRLDAVAAEGAIAGRAVLERKYEMEKQQAVLQAQREALVLHGLSEEQLAAIERDRKLLQGLSVFAPEGDEASDQSTPLVWQIQDLKASPGQHVEAGDTLAVLTDYRLLFIQGTAFEQDTRDIQSAIANAADVTALAELGGKEPEQIGGLKLVYASGRVDPLSRTFHFYAKLPNQLLRDVTDEKQHRFVDWRFKPGQRVQLRVPVEVWNDSLVLPVGAVAREGAESYVFQVAGDSFVRRPVHEQHRDQVSVVVANDGSIFPGDVIAMSAAQQLQIALKNKSGGAVDPHAGHHH